MPEPADARGPVVEPPFVTVVMPVRNEAGFIARSVGAVLDQTYPPDRLEVIVADGGSTDGTRDIVERLSALNPRLSLIDNPGRIVPTGLNAAIRRARGSILIRVDGHCEVAPDYVERCVAHLSAPGVEVVGGPLQTIGETPMSMAIAAAMSSPFGVGNAAFRTGQLTAFVDTVAFPAYPRSLVERAGPFDEELVRNQDDEYNDRLRKMGARILLAADVKAKYYGRSSLRRLWRQYFQYGYWKVRVMQKHRRQMRPRQFVPPAFVALLCATAIASLWWPGARIALVVIVGTYAATNLAASVVTAIRVGWWAFPVLVPAFVTLHVSYGAGFLYGLARFWNRWGDQLTRATDGAFETRPG